MTETTPAIGHNGGPPLATLAPLKPILCPIPVAAGMIGRTERVVYSLIGAGKIRAVKSDGRTDACRRRELARLCRQSAAGADRTGGQTSTCEVEKRFIKKADRDVGHRGREDRTIMLRSPIITGIVRSAKSHRINRAGPPSSTDGNALATWSAAAVKASKPTPRSTTHRRLSECTRRSERAHGSGARIMIAVIDLAAIRRAKQAAARSMQKGRCKHFDRAAAFVRTRREIERHARYKGAADTDDLARWLIAWKWFNPWSKDQVGALIEAARRMGRKHLTIAQAEDIIAEARCIPRRMKADELARWLGVTYAERQRLGLTRIGACDIGKRARTILRKRRDRLAKERKRREAGSRPRAEYLARISHTTDGLGKG
jgi:hypothetical protein